MIDPIYLAAIGTIVVISSVLITGPHISSLEKNL